jgi:hypothetical protein
MAVLYLSNYDQQPGSAGRTVNSPLALIAVLINRGEDCDAEEQRDQNQRKYASGDLLCLKMMRHVGTPFRRSR